MHSLPIIRAGEKDKCFFMRALEFYTAVLICNLDTHDVTQISANLCVFSHLILCQNNTCRSYITNQNYQWRNGNHSCIKGN
jgi:hypothetical protein